MCHGFYFNDPISLDSWSQCDIFSPGFSVFNLLINLIEEGKKTRLKGAGEDRRARSGVYRVGPLRSGRRDSEDTESEERVRKLVAGLSTLLPRYT